MRIVDEYNLYDGARVVRGRDWQWDDQDRNGIGTLQVGAFPGRGWYVVTWDYEEDQFSYRVGTEDCYDLYFYEEEIKEVIQEPITFTKDSYTKLKADGLKLKSNVKVYG